jgi:DNA repair protein RadC
MNTTQPTLAEIELSYKPKKAHHPIIKSSADVYYHLLRFFPEDTIALQERFVAGYVNRANRLIGVCNISTGGITGTVADPKLIIAVALKSAATGIILAHNHPSGNLQPSEADIEITKKIQSACKFLDINLLDHIIIAPQQTYFSFVDENLL